MNSLYKISSNIFCNVLLVETNAEEIGRIVFDLAKPFVGKMGVPYTIEESDIYVKILKKNACYVFESSGNKINIDVDKIYSAMQDIIFDVLTLERDIIMIHGALVKKNEKTVALLGATGSGKSTLTAYLSLNGYEYVADDKFCVNVKTGEIFPFVRRLTLRDGGFEFIKRYENIQYETISYGEYKRFSISNVNNVCPSTKTVLLFIYRDDNGIKNYLQEKMYSSIVKNILENLYKTNNSLAKVIRNCQLYASSVESYDLNYTSLGHAKNMIDSLIL